MWQFPRDRAGITNRHGQSNATQLYHERSSIRDMDGAGYENNHDSANCFGHRFRGHADSHF